MRLLMLLLLPSSTAPWLFRVGMRRQLYVSAGKTLHTVLADAQTGAHIENDRGLLSSEAGPLQLPIHKPACRCMTSARLCSWT